MGTAFAPERCNNRPPSGWPPLSPTDSGQNCPMSSCRPLTHRPRQCAPRQSDRAVQSAPSAPVTRQYCAEGSPKNWPAVWFHCHQNVRRADRHPAAPHETLFWPMHRQNRRTLLSTRYSHGRKIPLAMAGDIAPQAPRGSPQCLPLARHRFQSSVFLHVAVCLHNGKLELNSISSICSNL
ncbi:hypothetical protein D3C78_1239520 [compost metagenome]